MPPTQRERPGGGTIVGAWLKASRPTAQAYLFIPLLAGQCYAWQAGFPVNWQAAVLAHAFGLAIHLFIVYANDLADLEVDRHNHTFTFYSGGSRVLVDGDLSRSELGRGAILAAIMTLACCLALSLHVGHWLALAMGLAAILLLLMYSYPPCRCNYRGGGELLQMAGTAILLPLFGWHAQTGGIAGFPVQRWWVLMPTALACAVGTSLPDELADRLGGKRSATVILGQQRAQAMVVILHGISLILLLMALPAGPTRLPPWWATALFAPLALMLISSCGGQPGSPRLCRFGLASIIATLAITLATAIAPAA